ncbi:uncharacterized protein C8A04DRAFT_31983 [Dichotomopilus funicola]|uniref:Prion-inhibition and propagation HeLo domain-containing protein n=1 Tax=Dichotomopilus funicola TaxID=1934379 RepID=A0AAN6UWN2_9PEZI|nr:hypothetical protein C8A04DRAFT_31983 [Dichotomopilus funicola]
MDSFIPMGGVQLPAFQRRLSRLYNDTKKSSDFVKDAPVHQHAEADPEIKTLHRKLRIQKDRLVTWGLEWSDPNQNQSAEVLIDSSLSKAGLSEVVGSIMSTIKDILAEAEPLWNSSRRLAGERVDSDTTTGAGQQPKRGEKIRMVVWDKSRFEDLIRDLTTSIDTLYDLSRTRSSQASAAIRQTLPTTTAPSPAPEDLRPFESSRMQTPQQIDPNSLTNLRSMQAEPMTERAVTEQEQRAREIVFMSKQAFAELTQTAAAGSSTGAGASGTGTSAGAAATRQAHAPLLLEYASFDSIYSMTGISPPMARFEKVSAGLQAEPQRSPGSWTGLPRLLGYFEDMDNARFGLVYQFPRTFNPVTFEHLTQNPLYNLCSLADLLARPDFEPKLEAKFRLAANLANTVFDMHARGITHGNLVGDNISFCNAVGTDPEVSGITQGEVDIRRPLISSFDLFSEPQTEEEPGQSESRPFSLYKHPLDPRNSGAQSPLAHNADSKTFDLYSLAMVLLSVGLWTKLENLVPNMDSPTLPASVLEQLAIRCGTLYMKAVQTCWNAVDLELTGAHVTEQIVSRVQFKASRYLEACCILDGVSNLEERLGDDLGEPRAEPVAQQTQTTPTQAQTPTQQTQQTQVQQTQVTAGPSMRKSDKLRTEGRAQVTTQEKQPGPETKPKMRLYPHVPLPPDIIDKWNTVFMPQINTALRHFYRKHPESVEISLESIGDSPQRTTPTVLVVCTSVGKVKAILKKKLGSLFDGAVAGGISLKVCRGQVLRSRKQTVTGTGSRRTGGAAAAGGSKASDNPSRRSMAKAVDEGSEGDGDEVVAANPEFQERPRNGASIGAWIGDRHLPPVSLGGVITVDERQYGMTVHHMLDDPDQAAAVSSTAAVFGKGGGPSRSMAGPRPGGNNDLASWYAEQYQLSDSDSASEGYTCEFSDSENDDMISESAITSDYSDEDDDEYDDEDEDDPYSEPGDIPGVEPGCGEGYIITQPALDDVPEGFYPSAETEDEDHLDTYTVGEVYASSGIRRRTEGGLLHEIDWALFEFDEQRVPEGNVIPHVQNIPTVPGKGPRRRMSWEPELAVVEDEQHVAVVRPTSVVPSASLPGLEVQCMARTSGLQSGLILPAVASVKIYGRASPSHIYQVSGTNPNPTTASPSSRSRPRASSSPVLTQPMGIPGDSGAWVVDRDQGAVCGHILAWSERKRVAYICPMDVLLLDIAETLEAGEIRLPGGEVIYSRRRGVSVSSVAVSSVTVKKGGVARGGSKRGGIASYDSGKGTTSAVPSPVERTMSQASRFSHMSRASSTLSRVSEQASEQVSEFEEDEDYFGDDNRGGGTHNIRTTTTAAARTSLVSPSTASPGAGSPGVVSPLLSQGQGPGSAKRFSQASSSRSRFSGVSSGGGQSPLQGVVSSDEPVGTITDDLSSQFDRELQLTEKDVPVGMMRWVS